MTLILCPPYTNDDPFRDQIVLEVPFQGTAGSTSILDSKGVPFSNNGVVLSNANAQLGTAGYFSGGPYLDRASSADLVFGTSDWTIDFWLSLDSITTAYQEILVKGPGLQIYAQAASMSLALSANNTTSYFVNGAFGTLQRSVATHIAVQKRGQVYTGYFGGVGTVIANSALVADTGTSPLIIGSYLNGAYPILGFMRNLRITKAARYGANFTPTL